MDFLPLVTIPVFLVLVALTKPSLMKYTGWNVCAICVAVSATWVTLLSLLWRGFILDTTAVAILMGMSVTGFMYKLETYYNVNALRHLWMARLVTVLGGFLTVMLIVERSWQGALVSGIGSLIGLVIISFLLQGTTHREAVESAGDGVKKSLLKKLDNCC